MWLTLARLAAGLALTTAAVTGCGSAHPARTAVTVHTPAAGQPASTPMATATHSATPVTTHAARHHRRHHHHPATAPAVTTPAVPPPPPTANPIPQGNGGDQDADNNGGPSDGDGNI